MNELQKDITQFLTAYLSRSLRDKITNSESMEIVKGIEAFIEHSGGLKPKPKQEDIPHHDFMEEIKKI